MHSKCIDYNRLANYSLGLKTNWALRRINIFADSWRNYSQISDEKGWIFRQLYNLQSTFLVKGY